MTDDIISCFKIIEKLFFKGFNLLDFHQLWFIFLGKIFFTTLLLPILKVKFSVAEIVKRI